MPIPFLPKCLTVRRLAVAVAEGDRERADRTPSEPSPTIDSKRQHANLSSVIRLFVLDFYQQQIPVRKRPDRKG